MAETVKVTINGVEYEVQKGRTILQTARELGIPIPYFCWHKHLSVSGNCRMCLVNVKPGPPKPQIACGTYVGDGMEIDTDSEQVHKYRRDVLEFLLLNHPLDCPVCDKAYECKLQNYTYNYGNDAGRCVDFHDQKRVYKRVDHGKLFTEMNRCIQCTRCVRYLKEVAGVHEMERLERGHLLKIGTFKESFESDFVLNAVDICPVGALGDRKFNYSVRVWNLHPTPTVCSSCSVGCNVTMETFENDVYRLRARENEAVNATWMCDHGRHNFDYINENRLEKVELNGKAVDTPVRTEDAAKAVIDGVEKAGTGNTMLLLSSSLTTEELYTGKKLAELLGVEVRMLGGFNEKQCFEDVTVDVLPVTLVSDDKSPNTNGGQLLGLDGGSKDSTAAQQTIEAVGSGKIKALIVVGEDLAARSELDAAAANQTLSKLDFYCFIGANRPAGDAKTNVLLPAATSAEKRGTFVNRNKRVQRLRKARNLPGFAKDDLTWLSAIGQAKDDAFGFESYKEAFAAMVADTSELGEMDWNDIGLLGIKVPEAGAKAEKPADEMEKEKKLVWLLTKHTARDTDRDSGHDA